MRRPVTINGERYTLDTKETGGGWWEVIAYDAAGRPVNSVEAKGNAGEIERQVLAELEDLIGARCQTLNAPPSTTQKEQI